MRAGLRGLLLLLCVPALSASAQSPLTLGRALQSALAANPDLRIVAVRVAGASAAVRLARGPGEEYVAAGLRAADRELDAANAQRHYAVSLAMRDTAIAYWDYLARWRQLEIARTGEERTAALAAEIRKLVAADELPASELDLAIANATERANNRIAAEQVLLDAHQALGRLMGVEPSRLAMVQPPASDFPFPSAAGPQPPYTQSLIEEAEGRREDLRAQELQIEAARERVLGSRDSAPPLAGLSVGAGVSGLREGNARSASPNPFALGGSRTLAASQRAAQYPLGNHAVMGQIGEATAAVAELEIRRDALRAEIAAGVTSAAEGLRRAALQLAGSRDLVSHYTKALESEKMKRRLGISTLLDILAVEDRLQNTQLRDIDQRRNYAVALVQLKHQLGVLVQRGSGESQVREVDFLEYQQPR